MKAEFCMETVEDVALDEQKHKRSGESQSQSTLSILVESNKGSSEVCVFGTCLEHLMRTSPCLTVPYVVSRLCKFIEKYGLYQQCLFQETQEKSVIDHLKRRFNESGDAPLESSGDVPAASVLLKLFFEELPEPLIPTSMQADFFYNIKKCVVNSGDCVKHLKFLVDKLPCSAFCVLKYLSHFLFRIAVHGESNGLSCANLGVIFGPVIFRPVKRDPLICVMVKNITHCFVADYYSIFEEECNIFSENDEMEMPKVLEYSETDRQVSPRPSTIMPGVPMQPLQVMIPPVDTLPPGGDHSLDNLSSPLLLIESSDLHIMDDIVLHRVPPCSEGIINKMSICSHTTRKRKENLLSGEAISLCCNAGSLPSLLDLLGTKECLHAGKQDEEIKDHQPVFDTSHKNDLLSISSISSEKCGSVDHSPHPPDPKRRELDSMDYPRLTQKYEKNRRGIKYNAGLKPWLGISRLSNFTSKAVSFKDYNVTLDLALQNSDTSGKDEEQEEEQIVESCLSFLDSPLYDSDNSTSSAIASLPRSSSCPLSVTDGESNFESESTSLSLSWNMLFDSEEPLRSEHHRSWTMMKGSQEEEPIALSVQNHQKLSDAPLSPSAYRSYLSHRSSHLDPSVPPSPPIEQEHFEKSCGEDAVSCSVKQLTKKIYALKKKIWRFEEKYESEYGYKPSHAEKTKFPEAKKLMTELHKARKELKALKEETHMISDSCSSVGNWVPTREVHILEDTTNCLKDGTKDFFAKSKPSVQASFGETLKSLDDDRKLANRPESIEHMSSEQVKDEKLAIQKVLLQFESIHGKPCKTTDRNTVRPLYERYRNVKRLLVRSSSFPICTSKGSSCKGLQPIMEHETMDFSSLPDAKAVDEPGKGHTCLGTDVVNADIDDGVTSMSTDSSQILDNKYNNSNLHELPLPEMISQQQHARVEKRRLRKILREFEAEFLRINGRKVQKEDKAPVEALYTEYKLVKARLRLLEALISKHYEHILV